MALPSRNIHTETEIAAPAAEVWACITDLPAIGDWNPVMTRVTGEACEGASVSVRFDLGVPMVARCRVLACDIDHELRWRGGPPGLLSVEHYFACRPLPGGRTLFIHGETFTGVVVPFVWPVIGGRVAEGYTRMNDALRARLEDGGRARTASQGAKD